MTLELTVAISVNFQNQVENQEVLCKMITCDGQVEQPENLEATLSRQEITFNLNWARARVCHDTIVIHFRHRDSGARRGRRPVGPDTFARVQHQRSGAPTCRQLPTTEDMDRRKASRCL
jgi:hypothetical protein